ncbi:MAG: ribosome biogenesis GTP-binding protein YihA/YsxC [bacterium]
MNIQNAEFIKGIVGMDKIVKEEKPQIAFAGRSNVGKSSVINSLLGRKKLVKSSSNPGKTKEINFFLIDNKVYFVDLPGYGFAKMEFIARKKLAELIMWYLQEPLVKRRKVVLIIDAKVGLTEFDFDMLRLLEEQREKFIVVANKADKLKKNEMAKQLKFIQESVGKSDVILYSAKTKLGREELLNKIFIYENWN